MNDQTPEQRIEGISTDQLIERGHEAVIGLFMIPNSLLPKKYQGKRKKRKLQSIVNQLNRKQKAKLERDPRSVIRSPERQTVLDYYQETAGDIDYQVNENLQFNKMLRLVEAFNRGEPGSAYGNADI